MNNEIDLNYNYVYFNSNYIKNLKTSSNEYNAICLRDAEELKEVRVVPCQLSHLPYFFRWIYGGMREVQRKTGIPFEKLWYPFFIKTDFKNKKKICFVIANLMPFGYLKYLRKKFPGCKLVKIHRDLIKTCYWNDEYTIKSVKEMFDLLMTYDEGEAIKYNMVHFDEIESKIDIPVSQEYPLSDVFFAGKAKDRLPKILSAYNVLHNAGLKCDFYITDVPKDDQIVLEGIEYSDKLMPYDEMLYRSINSKCMLDINQSGADGYTSRILEAIIYNKRIIMDNSYILKSKYYNPKYIQVVEDMSKIDPTFVMNDEKVDYGYQGDFSPVHLIKQIDDELVARFGE